jgi:hemolysin III
VERRPTEQPIDPTPPEVPSRSTFHILRPPYRRLREPVNGLTHLAGAAISVVVLAVLVGVALYQGKVRHLIAFAVFGLSLVALYTASALYHLLPLSKRWVARLRRLDHMMIFVLIAGTYTPFCLIALHGGWRWGLLGVVWGLALAGIGLKIWWMHAPIWFSTATYIAIGWVALAASPAIVNALPPGGLAWVIAGGVIYSLGAIVFAVEWPVIRRGVFEAHELWHLFVMAGSGCHIWAVARYLTPLH